MRFTSFLALVLVGCASTSPEPIPAYPVIVVALGKQPALQPLVQIVMQMPAARSVRVCAGGDVMLGSDLDTSWAVRRSVPALPDPFDLMAALRPMVTDADIVLLNVEGAIGSGPAPRKCRRGSTNCYAFRQPPAVASALRSVHPGGAVVGNVANNHAMDAGAAGFAETVRQLARAGVFATGHDTLATLVSLPSGDTIAFLGFSTFQAGPSARDLAAVRRHVTRSAVRWRTIVTVHHGAEGVGAQRTADRTEQFLGEDRGNPVAFARAATESGAVAVFGHGPHVLRAAAWVTERPVFFSLGNLLTYGPFSMAEPLNRGGLACLVLDHEGRLMNAEFRSTYQVPPGRVAVDRDARAILLVDSLSQLDFPGSALRLDVR